MKWHPESARTYLSACLASQPVTSAPALKRLQSRSKSEKTDCLNETIGAHSRIVELAEQARINRAHGPAFRAFLFAVWAPVRERRLHDRQRCRAWPRLPPLCDRKRTSPSPLATSCGDCRYSPGSDQSRQRHHGRHVARVACVEDPSDVRGPVLRRDVERAQQSPRTSSSRPLTRAVLGERNDRGARRCRRLFPGPALYYFFLPSAAQGFFAAHGLAGAELMDTDWIFIVVPLPNT